jgi:hypothetical protein
MSDGSTLRPCPCCGGPAVHAVILRKDDPRPIEEIRCQWCGLMLRADVSTHAELADLWNTRSVTDGLLKHAIPVLKMALAMFRSQGIPGSTELGLLNRIQHHLGEEP